MTQRTGIQRATTYRQFISSNAYYLTLKAQARRKDALKNTTIFVNALKDADGKVIIDSYNLNARLNPLAWSAWRELYYMFYPHLQEITTVEGASTPYTTQAYSKQPYEV